ncbi:MAG: ribulose-phosphate 3-epimerase [Candidatus Cloacimonetes bacterium]|jgi:ribulose-phosphate 3-epimerase|nr:ribulose-phosphate 3-epimerase [Candidatus Cloacimonadota bacterium]
MIKIAPSLLSADFVRLEEEINKIQNAGADILHLDIMDGHFVPNLTFGLPIIKQIKDIAQIPVDVHLMVNNPDVYLETLGKWDIDYVSFHQEAETHIHRQLKVLQKYGVKAGIALNPATPVETIFPVIADLDFILIMSVNPGFGGQSFIPLVYEKIEKLRKLANQENPDLEIEVDGGVNNINAPKLISSGVDILVAGSFIFGSDNYKKQIQNLRNK